jgi:hypothetical protein
MTRTIITLLLLTLALPLAAKDTALTPAWNGMWSDATGQHRCAIRIADGKSSRLTVLCHMGPDGVFADLTPMPDPGWQIFVDATLQDFGAPGGGHFRWGQISWHGLCDASGPFIVANIYSAPVARDVTFRPVAVTDPAALCSTGARP